MYVLHPTKVEVTVAGLAGKDAVTCSRKLVIVTDTSLEEDLVPSPLAPPSARRPQRRWQAANVAVGSPGSGAKTVYNPKVSAHLTGHSSMNLSRAYSSYSCLSPKIYSSKANLCLSIFYVVKSNHPLQHNSNYS